MKFILLITSSAFIVSLATAKDVISDLLAETIQQLPERVKSPEAIAEKRVSSLEKFESFLKIEIIVNSSWERDLPKISEFAGSESEKTIYFKAAQRLSRNDYIRFMTTATLLVANGEISEQQFIWGIFPEEKNLREMWMENPPNPQLKNLAYQSSLMLAHDKNMKVFFDKVISGQLAIDNIGKDEKSLSETPSASQKQPSEVLRPDKRPSESPKAETPLSSEFFFDSSATGLLVQQIGESKLLKLVGIIGIVIAAILFWYWKSKPTR